MSKILDPNQSYTFSKFFELNIGSDRFVAEFGYRNVRFLNGTYYQIKSGNSSFMLPANMQYRFSE